MTPAGIEPATFRFVAQHLNHCATAVPLRRSYLLWKVTAELETDKVAYFKKIKLSGFSAYPDGSSTRLIRISGLLYCVCCFSPGSAIQFLCWIWSASRTLQMPNVRRWWRDICDKSSFNPFFPSVSELPVADSSMLLWVTIAWILLGYPRILSCEAEDLQGLVNHPKTNTATYLSVKIALSHQKIRRLNTLSDFM